MKKLLLAVSTLSLSILSYAPYSLGADDPTIADLLKQAKTQTPQSQRNYNAEMRSLIEKISTYSRGFKSDFIISVRSGAFLMKAKTDSMTSKLITDDLFLKSIDGIFVDGLSFGSSKYNHINYGLKTPHKDLPYTVKLLNEYARNGKFVGVFDHVDQATVKNSLLADDKYASNHLKDTYSSETPSTDEKLQDLTHDGVKKHAHREESAISYVQEAENKKLHSPLFVDSYDTFKKLLPKANAYSFDKENVLTLTDYLKATNKPKDLNSKPIYKLSQAKTFLYISRLNVNMSPNELIKTLANTNYDVIIMNSFYKNGFPYKPETIEQLKYKKSGVPRLVLSTINVAVATKGSYYWQDTWKKGDPSWLKYRKPNTVNSYFTNYWDPSWQYVLTGHNQSYMYGVMLQHFDGVVIEGANVAKYFEDVSSGAVTPN